VKPEKKSLTINKLKVTYYKAGKGRTVVFFHGGRTRALSFKKYLYLLSLKHEVIAPDIPGYGDSDTPNEIWSFIEYGKFFSEFLKKLNLTNVTVIGYSMGGGIAFNVASQNKNVSKLILIDSSGISTTRNPLLSELRRVYFYLSHPQYYVPSILLLKEYLLFRKKHLFSIKKIDMIRNKCHETDYSEILSALSTKTLLIWGIDDWIYPLSVANKFNKLLPKSELMTVNGTHDWLYYNPLLNKYNIL